MKKTLLLICAALIGGYTNNCHAVDPITWGAGDTFNGCYTWSCLNPTGDGAQWYGRKSPSDLNCRNYTAMCFYQSGVEMAVASCQTCNPGYELTTGTPSGITACSGDGDINDNGSGVSSYEYTSCVKNCQASNCAPSSWSALRTGYESRTYRSCSATGASGTCNASTQYRCAAGYYGTSTNGTSGCNPCPEWKDVYANSARTTKVYGTSSAGATAITGCYVVAGTYYDATGTFKTTGNCQYK